MPALNLALRTSLLALFLLLGISACGSGGKGTEPTRPQDSVISDLVVSAPDGHKASLGWRTDRPCSATVSYQKPGGPPMIRRWMDAKTARQVALDLLEPGTSYTLTLQVKDADQNTSTASSQVITGPSSGAPGIRITVDPSTPRSISPYIYGLNYMAMIGSENAPHVPQRLTLDRVGGNRWTVYNWENNASNAGIDWHFTSDGFVGGGETPAEAVRLFVEAARNRGQASIITVPIQGYVAADKAGPVDPSGADLATRFKQVIPKKAVKSAVPFSSAPDLTDPYVFVDEFLWTFQNRFTVEGDPSSDVFAPTATHPVLVSLDNEPDLWHSTHPEVQGTTLHSSADLLARTQATARALKDQFPDIQLLGPAHYGINGLYSWRDTYPADPGGDWFMDHYLREMKAASDQDGRRLLDVFDFHWYPEISVEGTHIFRMSEAELTEAQVQAIVQSPRDWWDEGFLNKDSWLPALLGGPTRFLDRVQSKVEAAYPGTRVAITEYYFGGVPLPPLGLPGLSRLRRRQRLLRRYQPIRELQRSRQGVQLREPRFCASRPHGDRRHQSLRGRPGRGLQRSLPDGHRQGLLDGCQPIQALPRGTAAGGSRPVGGLPASPQRLHDRDPVGIRAGSGSPDHDPAWPRSAPSKCWRASAWPGCHPASPGARRSRRRAPSPPG